MQAIPTIYKGIQLRSRLEADAAFLLDEVLGYEWQYEPKSFLLPDGTHYMPDFYVPDSGIWVECRGVNYEKGDRQIEQFAAWARGVDHEPFRYIVFGPGSDIRIHSLFTGEGGDDVSLCWCSCGGGRWVIGTLEHGRVVCHRCVEAIPYGELRFRLNLERGKITLGYGGPQLGDWHRRVVKRERRAAIKVYMAGKISASGWRHSIVPGLRQASLESGDKHDSMPIVSEVPRWDVFEYGGPYFVSCDHGCMHGRNQHGVGATLQGMCYPPSSSIQMQIVEMCREWIGQSDVVFAWLDSRDAFGSLVEIGYALALGVPVYLYEPDSFIKEREELYDLTSKIVADEPSEDVRASLWGECEQSLRHLDDLWFVREMATANYYAADAMAAWADFARRVPLAIEDATEKTYATVTR